MTHLRLGRVLAPLLALVAIPACAKKPPSGEPPAPAVVVADPAAEDAGAIPPPRAVPPAAEPSDATDAMEVLLIADGKGGWKVQYAQGRRLLLGGGTEEERRTSGELVLPLHRPVKFTLDSETGAAHFEIAAFPLSIVLGPNGPASVTMTPKRAGEFGIWSGRDRVGSAVVVPAAEFENWLAGISSLQEEQPVEGSLAHTGRQLFFKLNCIKCHTAKADSQGPNLEGLFGQKVKLKGGEAVVVDEAYIVESIRKPRAKVVEGWIPLMPMYGKEDASEEDVQALVAYIKSLKPGGLKAKEERFPPPVGAPGGRVEQPRLEPLNPPELAPPPREKPGGG